MHPVKGQVLLNGKPIPYAQVVFHPLGESSRDAPKPSATVDEHGHFALTTQNAGDGAPAGDYAVTVEWWLSPAASKQPGAEDRPPVNHLPKHYARAETSPLRVHIEPGTNEVPPLHLKK